MSLRSDALRIFRAGLAAADPASAVRPHVARIAAKLHKDAQVWVFGAGKATARMAWAVERELGAKIAGGWINVKDGHTARLRRIVVHECSHPVPDERGVEGTKRIAEMVRRAAKGDLVLCLISGGASALMPLPAEGITLAEKQETTRLLLACGANIHELNCVRKHISGIKGGHLAKLAFPARVEALILSDVIGDDLDVIGSGPTVADSSTAMDAREILERFAVWNKIPATVRRRIASGAETPKPGDPELSGVRNSIVGSNAIAATACGREAKRLGYRTTILSTTIDGETRDVARVHAAIAREIAASGQPLRPPACVISGGETTVTIQGNGKGGRNQEFALAAGIAIAGQPQTLIFSAGTDGTDGPTDAAGAWVDGGTIPNHMGAESALANNDSYNYFRRAGNLVITGPTGTNVMDLRIVLVRH